MMPNDARKSLRHTSVFITGLAVVAGLSGCYQRTVSARGIGASSYEISEPYQESGQLDEWIFGPPAGERRVTPLTRNAGRTDR